jgi:hypothetical protein
LKQHLKLFSSGEEKDKQEKDDCHRRTGKTFFPKIVSKLRMENTFRRKKE